MSNILVTQADLNEATKLQRRQQYEEERKKRIFNAKQRLYGVSVKGPLCENWNVVYYGCQHSCHFDSCFQVPECELLCFYYS